MSPISLYLHIPFCVHRCAYCDFNTYAGLEALIPEYVSALCREVAYPASALSEPLDVHTVFFGGGTPSLLPLPEMERVLETLRCNYRLLPEVEITVEANPGTLSQAYLSGLHSLGVNRLSLGMQSANVFELAMLERQHSVPEVIQSVAAARKAGFDNLNLDLIYGLPGQALETWLKTLDLALALKPEHLSLYALTIEHGTPFQHWMQRGLLVEPEADLAADMYEAAAEKLEAAGFQQYEISNFARSEAGKQLSCRHNLQYWRNLPYLGFGAGAHGYAGGLRTANVLAPAAYIRRLADPESPPAQIGFPVTPACANAIPIDRQTEIGETMMMGLRLTQEGIADKLFRERFGSSLEELFAEPITRLAGYGLLEWAWEAQRVLRLTRHGRLLGNQVFSEFI